MVLAWRFIHISLLATGLGVSFNGLLAQELNLEDQRLYRSPYLLGRGDAGLALSDGHEAIFYNPAGLAQGKGIYKETVFLSPAVDISAATKDLARQLAVEKQNDPQTLRAHVGKNQHFGLSNFTGLVFRRAALGALVSTNNNLILKKSPEQRGLEVLEARSVASQVVTFSFAEGFWNNQLMLGTTVKGITQNYAELEVNVVDASNVGEQLESDEVARPMSGYGADLGLMWVLPGRNPFHLGLTVQNAGDTKLQPKQDGEQGRSLKQTVNVGLGYRLNAHLSHMLLALDFRDATAELETNIFKRLHIGAELAVGELFGITAGWNQGYPGAGLYTDLYLIRLDLGTYTQEIGDSAGVRADTRYYFRLMTKL
jgi:hypothetical protein